MKVLSLFDGISCLKLALQKLGITDVTYFASEIDVFEQWEGGILLIERDKMQKWKQNWQLNL